MNQLSNRINAIEESATLAMAAKAREFKNKGIDVIGLSLGEPDFKTPLHICEAAKKAIDDGKYFAYPPVAGYQDLREALAAKYQKENNVPYKAENIVVSNGAKQSIANAMLALLNPGDEVIVSLLLGELRCTGQADRGHTGDREGRHRERLQGDGGAGGKGYHAEDKGHHLLLTV